MHVLSTDIILATLAIFGAIVGSQGVCIIHSLNAPVNNPVCCSIHGQNHTLNEADYNNLKNCSEEWGYHRLCVHLVSNGPCAIPTLENCERNCSTRNTISMRGLLNGNIGTYNSICDFVNQHNCMQAAYNQYFPSDLILYLDASDY